MILFAIIEFINNFVNDKIMFYNEFNFNDDKCLSLCLLINVSSLKTLIKTARRDFTTR